MADHSKIEWTEATWNPVVGCSVVSPGCTNCYAMKDAWRKNANLRLPRYHGLTKMTKGGPVWTGEVRTVPELLDWPLRKRKPLRIFVNSMSDLFHEDVPDEFIDRVFAVMASASRHTFQILTKRAERMHAYMKRVADRAPAAAERYEADTRAHFERYKMEFREGYSLPAPPTPELRFIYDSATRQEDRPTPPDGTTLDVGFSGGEYHWRPWPLSNVWLLVSVEDQKRADERIPLLLQTPAAVRGISAEPLLGPILLRRAVDVVRGGIKEGELGVDHLAGLNWVVVGGESGPGARPFDIAWARSLRDQCRAAGVPVFVKQVGAKPYDSGAVHIPVDVMFIRDRKGGDMAEWPEDLRVREYPR